LITFMLFVFILIFLVGYHRLKYLCSIDYICEGVV
jgi:hypothetical protein